MIDLLIALFALTFSAGTPLVLAGLGELVTEKSGVLNLGVEGMMLIGAVCAVITTLITQNAWIGIVSGGLAGISLSLIFAIVALSLKANQVACGLALTIFGIGLSAFWGRPYEGAALGQLAPKPLNLGALSDIPVVGPILFSQNLMVYLSLLLFLLVTGFLYRTKAGLALRAIGDAPESAHVKRAEQESFSPEAIVLRRSMPFSQTFGEGLMFVAFGKSLDAFEVQMRRMTGHDDGITDGLFEFSRPISGSYYWCPPVSGDGNLDLSALD